MTADVSNARHANAGVERRRAIGLSFFIVFFILSIPFPFYFHIGPIVIHSYRLVLLLTLIPTVLIWITGRAGGIHLPDILLVCFVAWASMTFAIAHGMTEAIEPSGALLLETFGAYLLGRVYIRDASSFLAMARLLFLIVLVLMPLALIESVINRSLILELFGWLGNVPARNPMEMRMGLYRSQVTFIHPIHYGIFCASVFSLTYFVVARYRSRGGRLIRTMAVGAATFFSLSTGAFVALMMQMALTAWDYFLRRVPRRWALLGLLAIAAYIAISLLSNRTPFHVFVTYLTFNVGSSYNRILIWNFGTDEVMRNPLFGIGYGEWERPSWMGSSMDNFWLVIAVRHGLPAFFLFSAGVLLVMYRLGRWKTQDLELADYRKGLLISLGGLVIAGVTVHFWSQIYVLFMFLLGSGVWMLDFQRRRSSPSARMTPAASPRSPLGAITKI